MLGSVGLAEVVIVFYIAIMSLPAAWAGWRIFGKAGYPTWVGLFAVFPPVALVLALFLAFAEWPIEKRPRASA